jgi:two-component system response regulator
MSTATKPSNILVVDDNFGDISLFHETFAEIEGFALHSALGLVQARAFLDKRPPFEDAPTPDLIFLDLRLPIFPGYALLPLIRDDPKLRHIKVVVFTSSDNEEDRRRCRDLGADDYILKPHDWPEWKTTIVSTLAKYCPPGRERASGG